MLLPWHQIMTFGMGVLQLAPHMFWNMTLRELAAAMTAFSTQKTVSNFGRADLERLQSAFPDTRKGEF